MKGAGRQEEVETRQSGGQRAINSFVCARCSERVREKDAQQKGGESSPAGKRRCGARHVSWVNHNNNPPTPDRSLTRRVLFKDK